MAKRKKKDQPQIDPVKLAALRSKFPNDDNGHDIPVTQAQIDQFMKEARWSKLEKSPAGSST